MTTEIFGRRRFKRSSSTQRFSATEAREGLGSSSSLAVAPIGCHLTIREAGSEMYSSHGLRGMVAITVLGNLAYWNHRTLRWDPAKWEFVGDPKANEWLERERRSPWRLPEV